MTGKKNASCQLLKKMKIKMMHDHELDEETVSTLHSFSKVMK